MQSARLIYLAHPVRPINGETWQDNYAGAVRYFDALADAGVLVIAPWLRDIKRLGTAAQWFNRPMRAWEATGREAALKRCERYASTCWAVALCGPRVSEGMQGEAEACGRAIRGLIGLTPRQAAAVAREFISNAPEGWA
jgi:hypothetical protein